CCLSLSHLVCLSVPRFFCPYYLPFFPPRCSSVLDDARAFVRLLRPRGGSRPRTPAGSAGEPARGEPRRYRDRHRAGSPALPAGEIGRAPSELQSRFDLVFRLLLDKQKKNNHTKLT